MNTYSYEDGDGNTQTLQSSYTHLVRFEKVKKNSFNATAGYLVLYEQKREIARSIAFSGGNGHPDIPVGTYKIRLDVRSTADSVGDLTPDQAYLAPNYGIQRIASYIPNDGPYNGLFRIEWGSIRAHLNPTPGETRRAYVGNYIHGKERLDNYTLGCVCERSEAVLNALWSLDYKAVPVVPVEAR